MDPATALGPDEVLEAFKLDDSSNIFKVGRDATRLNFRSQQVRALNLVWALLATGKITASSNIAVIGGGLAGATASAALAEKGIKVSLYERFQQLFQVQSGNYTRYIHPYINDWPLTPEDSTNSEASVLEKDSADLPILNWQAQECAGVMRQIWRGFKQIKDRTKKIELHKNTEVQNLYPSESGVTLLIGTPKLGAYKYDTVILCDGFGQERSFPNVRPVSYWENDGLHQPHAVARDKIRILISGTGDGGIIDTLRSSIFGFSHVDQVKTLRQLGSLKSLENNLLRIEKQAQEAQISSGQAEKYDLEFEMLQQYQDLEEVKELGKHIKRRNDTAVTLNGPTLSPINIGSSIINRLYLFCLLRSGSVQYVPGRLSEIEIEGDHQNAFIEHPSRSGKATIPSDITLIRHSTEKDSVPLSRAFSRSVCSF